MEIHLAVHGPETAVAELFLDGKALLVEAKTAKPEDKPLVVTGDRLEASGGHARNQNRRDRQAGNGQGAGG